MEDCLKEDYCCYCLATYLVYLGWTLKFEQLDIYLSQVLYYHLDTFLFLSYKSVPVSYLDSVSIVMDICRLSLVVIHQDRFLLPVENFVVVLPTVMVEVTDKMDCLGLHYNLLLLPVRVVGLVAVIL